MLRAADVLSEIEDGKTSASSRTTSRSTWRARASTATGRQDAHRRRRRALQEEQDRRARGSWHARRRGQGRGRRQGSRGREGRSSRPARSRFRSPARASTAGCSTPPAPGSLNELPERLAVVGAGASGTEIASAFGRFGTEVVLLEMLDQILPAEDAEIAKVVASEFRKQNVKVVDRDARRGGQGGQGRRRDHLRRRERRSSTTSASPPAARPTSRASGSTRPA